jgi:hypothetical protein
MNILGTGDVKVKEDRIFPFNRISVLRVENFHRDSSRRGRRWAKKNNGQEDKIQPGHRSQAQHYRPK